jgi:pimeloyl-ACP methyl ester carboxylesterase
MEKENTRPVPEINFVDEGKGNTIVLLHGFLESLEIWKDLSEKLIQEYRVIRIDLPGHGQSSCVAPVHTMPLMAEEVHILLEILGVEKCLLIGHSMGGYVSLAFARRFEKMLKGLILFHSHPMADDEETKKNRDRLIKIVQKDHQGFIKDFIPDLFALESRERCKEEIKKQTELSLKTSKEGIIAALEGMKVREDSLDLINNIKIPTLIIAGEHDTRVPLEKILREVHNDRSVIISIMEEIAHMGHIESPEESHTLIKHFASSIFENTKGK